MKNDSILARTFRTLFIEVGLKGALQGAISAVKDFFDEHEKEFKELVQRKETED